MASRRGAGGLSGECHNRARSWGNYASIDTTLIPPGTQCGATRSNPEQRKRLRYAGFATFCNVW